MADADAARLGGGRTVGTQRSITAPPAQQAAPAQKAPQAAPAPAGGLWGGILGGLALGGLLGYFFGGNGLFGLLVVAGLAFFAVVAVRGLMRSRAGAPMPVAAMGNSEETVRMPSPQAVPMSTAARFPAGFDADGFLRGAKVNFVKLQLANDRGDLEEIREITTPELFETLQNDVQARVGRQETDISGLEARLLDLATENGQYWASVGFSGQERERPGAQPASFSEVWNLVKPVDGSSGWLLAGIQQMH
ncbi:MAG TPA: Tim44-like domain-containing protein [Burkholderiales bacterium]